MLSKSHKPAVMRILVSLRILLITTLITSVADGFQGIAFMPVVTGPERSGTRLLSKITKDDERYLAQAVEYARRGRGHTFPNPAVGCVLVRSDTGTIIGSGFHPRAGFPHAEVFALLQAAGYVEDGVLAADSVLQGKQMIHPVASSEFDKIAKLAVHYATSGGPEQLFENIFAVCNVTAYVTLEPCCHFGRTPPCASSLVLSRASRVVVGFRDPNPRVDGGGVRLLESAGITVDLTTVGSEIHQACADLVSGFVKRIVPRPELTNYEAYVTGAMRRALRSLAGRMKNQNSLVEVDWEGDSINIDTDMEESWTNVQLQPEWMEKIDAILWEKELVLLRLSKVVAKKKGVALVGQKVAIALQAHVAQTLGHTVLLYRPSIPPILDLQSL